jgi:hypothetical protein
MVLSIEIIVRTVASDVFSGMRGSFLELRPETSGNYFASAEKISSLTRKMFLFSIGGYDQPQIFCDF